MSKLTEDNLEITLSAEFVTSIGVAVHEYGEAVVRWTWDSFMAALLPFSKEIVREQETVAMAKSLGLDQEQTETALRLLANLRGAENPHQIWLAAEILLRTVPPSALPMLLTALMPLKGEPQ